MLDFLKINAKGVIGFIAGLLLNAINAVVNGQVPWPTSLEDWGKYLVTSLVAGVMVWATGNKLTVKQVTKSAVEQGISVIAPVAIEATAAAAEAKVNELSNNLPGVIQVPVNEVAQQVSNTVTEVLKGLADNIPGGRINLKHVL